MPAFNIIIMQISEAIVANEMHCKSQLKKTKGLAGPALIWSHFVQRSVKLYKYINTTNI